MFVITTCGKKIDFNESSIKKISWNFITFNKNNLNYLKSTDLDMSKFNKETPKVIDFEDAVDKQIPKQILENNKTQYYVLQNINYNGINLSSTHDDFKLLIPKNSWTTLHPEQSSIYELISIFQKLNNSQDEHNSRNYFGSIFIIGFLNNWMCVYKISYTQGHLLVQSVLFKNSNIHLYDIVEETYGNYKSKKEHKYFMIVGKKNVSLTGYLKIKYGWLDTGVLRDISLSNKYKKEVNS